MRKIIYTLAAALLASLTLAGCGSDQQVDDVDFAQYCGDHVTNQVAPDQLCNTGNPRFQWSYANTGHHTWANGYDTTPDYVFVPIGRPLPMGVSYARPYDYSYHQPLTYSSAPVQRRVSVPYKQYIKTAPRLPASTPKPAATAPAAKPVAPASNPAIQRGGFGVPSAPRVATPSTPSFSGRSSSSSSSSRSPSRSGK